MKTPLSRTHRFFRSFVRWLDEEVGQKLRRRRRRGFLRLEELEPRWVPATDTWIAVGGSSPPLQPIGGDWDTASNWSLNAVPTVNDDAVIPAQYAGVVITHNSNTADAANSVTSAASMSFAAGSLSITTTGQFSNSFTLTGGTVSGNGTITLAGPIAWSGGTLSGSGETDIEGNASISGNVVLDTATLNVASADTVTQTATLTLNNGAVINNANGAAWTLNLPSFSDAFDGTGVFNNQGTYSQTNDGFNTVNIAFNNSGTLNVLQGSLVLAGGGTNSGTFSLNTFGNLFIDGSNYTFDTGTVVTGAGLFDHDSGLLIVAGNSDINCSSFFLDGGTFENDAILTVGPSTAFTWNDNSTLSGTGVTDLLGTSVIASISDDVTLDAQTLNNFGAMTSMNTVDLVDGAVINNEIGATWTLDQPMGGGGTLVGDGTGVFNNLGAFTEADLGPDYLTVAFNNSGSVSVQTGALTLMGNGTDSGSFNVSGSTTLTFSTGSVTFNAGTVINGAGSLELASAHVTVAGSTTFGCASVGFTVLPPPLTGNLLLNPGFETGDFSDWTVNDDSDGTSVESAGFDGYVPHSGNYFAALGASEELGTVAQTVATTVGQTYTIDFFLASDGNTPNEFQADFGSTTLFSQTNIPAQGYIEYRFNAVATSDTTTLTFYEENDEGYLALDDVFVGPAVPPPPINPADSTLTDSSVLTIAAGTTFQLQNDLNIDGTGQLINLGTIQTSTTTGSSTISPGFFNGGTVNVQSGTLTIQGDGTDSGTFTVAAGSTLTYSGGSDTFTDGALVNGAGTFAITGNETLTVTGGVMIDSSNFTLDSSTLTGSGTVTITGAMTWSSGTMSGTGETDLEGSASITGNVFLDTRTFNATSLSTVTQTANLTLSNGAVLNNQSQLWDLQNDSGILGTGTFNTSGDFQKSGGAGTSPFQVVVNNSGYFDVLSGTLSLDGGGTDTGEFTVETGATLDFGGGTHDLTTSSLVIDLGTISFSADNVTVASSEFGSVTDRKVGGLANAILIDGGIANFTNAVNTTGSASFTTLTLSSGALTGDATIAVAGTLTWSGGTMSGTGETDLQGDSTISGAATLDTRTLDNLDPEGPGPAGSSSATLAQTADLTVSNGAVINNEGNALWDIQNDSSILGSGTFNNTSTFQKSGGTGISSIGVTFNNNSLVLVLSGTLSLDGGGSGTGTYNPSAGATLDFGGNYDIFVGAQVAGAGNVSFSAGTVNISGGFSITGTVLISGGTANFTNTVNGTGAATFTNLDLSSGTLTGSSTTTVTGTTIWTSGTMSGTGLTILEGNSTISSGTTLDTRTLNNFGALLDDATTFMVTNGAVINNELGAVWSLQGGTIGVLGGSGVFNNLGTLQSSGATSSMVVLLNNSGVLLVQNGTLTLSGGGTDTGSDSVAAGATLAFAGGTYNLNAGSNLAGGGNLSVSSGTLNVASGFILTGNVGIFGGTANFANTVNGTSSATFTSLDLGFGTLTGTANLAVTGATTWSGGTMSGSGTTKLLGSSTFFASGDMPNTIDGRTVNNFGTLTTTNVSISLLNGGVLNNMSGATWNLQTTDLETGVVNNFGTLNVSGGFNLLSGQFPRATVTNAGTVNLASSSTFTVGTFTQPDGKLAGGGILNGNVVIDGGVISPGFSPGTLTIDGNYTQGSDASLNIEIAGLTAGSQYAVLAVSGTAQLGGTLDLSTLNGFVPSAGATFQILTAGAVAGTFGTVNGQQINATTSFTVMYDPKDVTIGVSAPPVSPSLDRVSTFSNGVWTLDLGANGTDPITFVFGATGDQGVVGDWNGDGYTAVGTVRVDTSVVAPDGKYALLWSLDYNDDHTWDSGDVSFIFGEQGDQIVLGDWNGDGMTKVGVVRPDPTTGVLVWSLDMNDTPQEYANDPNNYVVYHYGLNGDQIVTGDWTGDGKDQIGVVRADSSVTLAFGSHPLVWSLDYAGTGVYSGSFFTFGTTLDSLLVGDWNGDGKSKAGVAGPDANGYGVDVSLDLDSTGLSNPPALNYYFGSVNDIIFRGDWNGGGKDEIGVVRSLNATTLSFTLDSNGDGVYDAGDAVFALPGSSNASIFVGDWKGS